MDLGKVSFTFYICETCCLVGKHINQKDKECCKICGKPTKILTKYCNILDSGKLYDVDAHVYFSSAGQMVNYYDDSRPFKNNIVME